MLIRASDSVLVAIDMQERLVPAMQAPARTIRNTKMLLRAAELTGVPAILTEQYPQGLGHVIPEIRQAAGDSPIIPKMHFSCMEEVTFAQKIRALGRRQVVLAGLEAHICVVQTASSLVEEGFSVFVVSDATASRTIESEKACVSRLSAAGVSVVTTEMVIYEWLGKAGTPAFKEMLVLVK